MYAYVLICFAVVYAMGLSGGTRSVLLLSLYSVVCPVISKAEHLRHVIETCISHFEYAEIPVVCQVQAVTS